MLDLKKFHCISSDFLILSVIGFFLPSHHPQAYVGHPPVVQLVGSSDRWNSPSSPSGPALPWLAQYSPGTFNTYTSDISV